MTDTTNLADRLEAFIPRGDGYNSDYANTLTEAVEALRSAQSAQDQSRVDPDTAAALKESAVILDGIIKRGEERRDRFAQRAQVHGWQMVPVEPTPEILEAIWGRTLNNHDEGAKKVARIKYEAMLAAAPKPAQDDAAIDAAMGQGGSDE